MRRRPRGSGAERLLPGLRLAFVLLAVLAGRGALPAPGAARATQELTSRPVLSGRLRIAGSTTMAPLVSDLAARFRALHPGVTVEVRGQGSGVGAEDVRAGRAEIGMVTRPLRDTEPDLLAFPLARDALALLVHATNPIQRLTHAQIAAIFSGKLRNWSRAGGPDLPVITLTGGDVGGSTDILLRHLGIAESELVSDVTIGTTRPRLEAAAARPGAITVVSVSFAQRAIEEGLPLRMLEADGVRPERRAILRGDYPLARPASLVTRGLPAGLAKAFIEFALSPRASDVIDAHGLVRYEE